MPPDRPPIPANNVFAGAYVDRRADARIAADWAAAARRDPEAIYLLMRGTEALMRIDAAGQPVAVQLLPASDARVRVADEAGLTLLGWFGGARCLLANVTEAASPVGAGEAFLELRPFAGRLPEREAGLVAYARALSVWRANHRYCGRCGQPMRPARAGHQLECVACGNQSFPRIDPAIIVLVTESQRALLGRQPGWPPGRYSTIAGFVEPGEALEDAVSREVLEETGIEVVGSRYHSSQPWPFPSSLMLGFEASSPGGEPRADDSELEDVRWFTRAQVRSGEILLPPGESISRRLIEGWLNGADVG